MPCTFKTSWRYAAVVALAGIGFLPAACGRPQPVASETPPVPSSVTSPSSAPTTTTPTTAAQPAPESYIIQPGDSLGGIASAYGISAEELASYNNLQNPDRISAGQQLLIPPGATSTTTTPTTAAPPPPEPPE